MSRDQVVLCRADNADEFEYVPATRRLFTIEEAVRYAQTVSASRHARILPVADYLKSFEGWKDAN